jgi:hypothetical protein
VSERDVAGLLFTAEMYGVQLDQLAVRLAVSEVRARALAARWREQGYAESARLGPGRPWVWLTRDGLLACGLPYRLAPPALARLAHLRAVTAVRMALESAPGYLTAGAYWRSERRLRARMGSRVPLREHLPDGEVHWPDPDSPDPAGPDLVGPDLVGRAPDGGSGGAPPWAGECWAIEAELTRKTVRRTVAIMAEILTRTGDYGCPAAEVRVPGALPRHARVLYLCSAAARPTVIRARDALPGPLTARVEIRGLPAGAALTAGPSPTARPASSRSGGPSSARPSAARSSPASTPPARSSPASTSPASTSPARTPPRDGASPATARRDRASPTDPPRDSEAAT